MHNILEQLQHINHIIAETVLQQGRPKDSVGLLAVSKTQPASRIEEAYQAGQRAFGENYLQEAREKQVALQSLDIEWHFIGPIQSNKTKDIAEHFDWVHSVDRLKIAQRLSQQRPEHLPALNICVQLNIDNEDSKAGVSLEALPALLEAINALPQLALRGLMVIPEKRDSSEAQKAVFTQVADILQTVSSQHSTLDMDTLSMGMSDDMEPAIAAGATIVRVGSAIFGTRQSLSLNTE